MRGLTALLLLLLLASPSAATWSNGTLDSVAVRDATLAGSEVVIKVRDSEDEAPDLSVRAEHLRVAWHHSYEEYDPPVGTVSSEKKTGNDADLWSQAAVSVLRVRPGAVLFSHATAEVRLEDTRLSVNGHFTPSVTETSTTTGERNLTHVETPALHLVSSSTGTLTVTGDFTLSVYEWDIRVQNETSSEDYWSGERPAEGPLSTATIDGEENQRLYLDVTNGTLRLPLAGLDVRDLFVAGTALQAASAVLDLADQETPLSLAGPLRFGLGPVENGSFQGSVVPPDQARSMPPLDPEAEAPPAPSTSAVGEEGLWTTTALVLLLAVLVALLVGWRAVRLVRLRRAMSDGDYGSVAAGAGLESSRRFGAEVVVARVVCMVKTADYAAAASLLEKRGAQLAPGVRAYLWACVHAGTGAVEQARDSVIESVVTDPGMASEVAANRSLRRFLADVEEGAYS